MSDLSPFHLAIPVKDLDETLAFYEELLQCSRGRESGDWVDLNFLGHQLVLHRVERAALDDIDTNPVDGEYVPVPHFGVVLDWDVFESLTERLAVQKCDFAIPPTTRFEGRVGEQRKREESSRRMKGKKGKWKSARVAPEELRWKGALFNANDPQD